MTVAVRGIDLCAPGLPDCRSLPLLRLIASHRAGAVQLPYLPGRCLEFQVEPC